MAAPAMAPPKTQDPTPQPSMDQAITELHERKNAWLEVSLPRRVEYLRHAVRKTVEVAERQVLAATAALRMPDIAEACLGGPLIQARVMRLPAASLETLRRQGGNTWTWLTFASEYIQDWTHQGDSRAGGFRYSIYVRL